MSSFDAMRELPDEVVRLRSDLNAKDAELTLLKAENEALKEALRQIASFQEGPEITGSFDEPCSARIAREALSQSKTEAS